MALDVRTGSESEMAAHAEDRVRQAVLTHYGKSGHAPDLAKLKARDIVVLDEAGGSIFGADAIIRSAGRASFAPMLAGERDLQSNEGTNHG